MSRALALLLLVMLLPIASAQMRVMPGMSEAVLVRGDGPVQVELRIESATKDAVPMTNPWLVVGYDNLVNLTVRDHTGQHVNATFRLNVSGATISTGEIRLSVAPGGYVGEPFVVHATDTGLVRIRAEATDAFQPGGEPLRAELELPALALPSMRFLDPPVANESADDEFVLANSHGGSRTGSAYLRLRPGEAVTPRIEVTNPFPTSLAGFRLSMQLPGSAIPAVDVAPLESGERRVVEFLEYRPVDAGFGGRFGGSISRIDLRPVASVSVGGVQMSAGAQSFAIERGAVTGVAAASAVVDVQDGLVIDLYVPREPILGAPARVKVNMTNLQTTPVQGALTVTLMTPYGLFYEVQGPETKQVHVSLAAGQTVSDAIEFTPRVSGSWMVNTVFRYAEGFGTGSGGGFEVPGPVAISFDTTEQVFARIGEPVGVGIALYTSEALADALLRVASGTGYMYGMSGGGLGTGSAEHRPGFASRLVESQATTAALGALRPGGVTNTSIEVIGRSSGYYSIVPYVLADGFAYTSTMQRDPDTGMPTDIGLDYGASSVTIAVQPRNVPPGLALAPLTVGLAFFVGVWTFRTRFVK